MTLAVPNFIEAAKLADNTIRYRWDDWDQEQAEEPIDDQFLARLQGISQRAIFAFTAGTAEWIIHRFVVLSDDPLPHHYLEAAWAMMIDLRYGGATWEGYTNESEGWNGPVRRPLALTAIRTEYIFEAMLEYGNPEISGGWLTNLAQYVLTNPEPYLKWREQIMKRLESFFPRDPQDPLGDVIPREALDPDFDFRPEETEALVNQFLAGLDYESNPFLNSPDKMLKQGFTGIPYIFDIAVDRNIRHKT